MIRQITCVAASALLLTGCATAPGTYNVQKTRVYSEGKDVIWERVVDTFASQNLSIKTIEKASGLIAADRALASPTGMNGRILTWADCGNGGLAIPVSQLADLNVFVRPVQGGTSVTVNTRFQETRKLFDTFQTVSCASTGELEQTLLSNFGNGRAAEISSLRPAADAPVVPMATYTAPPVKTSAPAAGPAPTAPACGMVPQRDGSVKLVPCR
jgi:hypothetical protein